MAKRDAKRRTRDICFPRVFAEWDAAATGISEINVSQQLRRSLSIHEFRLDVDCILRWNRTTTIRSLSPSSSPPLSLSWRGRTRAVIEDRLGTTFLTRCWFPSTPTEIATVASTTSTTAVCYSCAGVFYCSGLVSVEAREVVGVLKGGGDSRVLGKSLVTCQRTHARLVYSGPAWEHQIWWSDLSKGRLQLFYNDFAMKIG